MRSRQSLLCGFNWTHIFNNDLGTDIEGRDELIPQPIKNGAFFQFFGHLISTMVSFFRGLQLYTYNTKFKYLPDPILPQLSRAKILKIKISNSNYCHNFEFTSIFSGKNNQHT